MKNPHKQQKCLNCNFTFDKPDNFCPSCGQENTDYHLSAKEMLIELVQSTFNFDSKLAHSFIPFLVKPGFLPRAFMNGKRKHYVHPVRFYLFISIIFFFFFSQRTDSLFKLPSADQMTLPSQYEIDSTFNKTNHFIDLAEKNGQLDSLQAAQMRKGIKGLNTKKLFTDELASKNIDIEDDSINISFGGKSIAESWSLLSGVWLRDPKMTPEALLDSLNIDDKSWMPKKIAAQALKYAQTNDPRMWKREVMDNIPMMMFILLPVFAIFLKIMYIRSGRWYIEHLVFSFHIHAYVFFIMTVFLLLESILHEWSLVGGIGLMILYPYAMFKNYYQQSIFKTFVKFLIIGLFYSILLELSLILELFISFMLF